MRSKNFSNKKKKSVSLKFSVGIKIDQIMPILQIIVDFFPKTFLFFIEVLGFSLVYHILKMFKIYQILRPNIKSFFYF